MDSRFSLLLVLSLLLFSTTSFASPSETESSSNGADDLLIRQVVDHDGVGAETVLGDHHHFSLFKKKFDKTYSSQEEHDYRFKVFKANLRRARRHQQLDPSATHGVTQFSDLTPSEFKKNFLGVRSRLWLPSDANTAPILPTDDLPADFDWREKGAVTPVKNQEILKGDVKTLEELKEDGVQIWNQPSDGIPSSLKLHQIIPGDAYFI